MGRRVIRSENLVREQGKDKGVCKDNGAGRDKGVLLTEAGQFLE